MLTSGFRGFDPLTVGTDTTVNQSGDPLVHAELSGIFVATQYKEDGIAQADFGQGVSVVNALVLMCRS